MIAPEKHQKFNFSVSTIIFSHSKTKLDVLHKPHKTLLKILLLSFTKK